MKMTNISVVQHPLHLLTLNYLEEFGHYESYLASEKYDSIIILSARTDHLTIDWGSKKWNKYFLYSRINYIARGVTNKLTQSNHVPVWQGFFLLDISEIASLLESSKIMRVTPGFILKYAVLKLLVLVSTLTNISWYQLFCSKNRSI